MKHTKSKKQSSGKLLKYIVKDNGKVLMELPPTKTSEKKVTNMSAMVGIEVLKVYE